MPEGKKTSNAPRQKLFHPRQKRSYYHTRLHPESYSGWHLATSRCPLCQKAKRESRQSQRPPENQWQNDAINFPADVTALNMRAFTGRRAAHRSPLVGQSVAALCTTARKHLAAIAGRHSFAEAMLLGALAFLRLISSKHFSAPPSFVRCPDGHRQMPVRAP